MAGQGKTGTAATHWIVSVWVLKFVFVVPKGTRYTVPKPGSRGAAAGVSPWQSGAGFTTSRFPMPIHPDRPDW